MAKLNLTPAAIAGICDHTFLQRPECFRGAHVDPLAAYDAAFHAFIDQTLTLPHAPYAVCVRPEEVARAAARLAAAGRTGIKLAAVVGFPLGDQHPPHAKAVEAAWALDAGATEIDVVLRWGALKKRQDDDVTVDIAAVLDVVWQARATLKVILEVCELTDGEIRHACRLCASAGVQFVKTSTGFGKGGATARALRIMRESFNGGVKIAGGVSKDNWRELLAAALDPGATTLDPQRVRIGESTLLPM